MVGLIMGALYLTLTKSYTAEKPNASNIFLDVKDFRMTDDFLTIDHRVLTRDCMIVDIQAFVNAKDCIQISTRRCGTIRIFPL